LLEYSSRVLRNGGHVGKDLADGGPKSNFKKKHSKAVEV
jgi:hypothetical protein